MWYCFTQLGITSVEVEVQESSAEFAGEEAEGPAAALAAPKINLRI